MEKGTLFWNTPTSQLLQDLQTNEMGLASDQAEERLTKYGPNLLKTPPKHFLKELLSRFLNPLVIILLLASSISAATGDVTGFIIIVLIVLMSVSLDFYQQYRAEQAAEELKASVAVTATVLRDGKRQERALSEIVPGDIVFIGAGDLIPADGVILEEKDIFINQALLTGESYPVEKKVKLESPVQEISRAENAVFLGTSVVSGSAKVLVFRTGMETSLGEISKSLSQISPPTAFDIGIHQFGNLIMRLTVTMVLFVVLVNVLFHRPWLESFLFAMALAVGLTPELLPMIITVTLSRGTLRMSKKKVIVKRLSSIQNLGSMDILCSDKTGTLTEGRIILERHVDVKGEDSPEVLQLAYLNSFFETGYRSPIDRAIIEHEELDVRSWQKIDEVPFDFERRRVSVLLDDGRRRILIVKGAMEEILGLSNLFSQGSFEKTYDLDPQTREGIFHLSRSLEGQGFRGIGIAWKEVSKDCLHAHVSDETELVFAGIAAFHDPPKAGIKTVLQNLSESHVSFRMVTGDSELVTRHLFQQVGVEVTGVLTGAQIQEMDDPALQARVESVNLFCRVSPTQKNRIIMAFKKRGHIVGYLGDGANDAPSLHSADVGISVEGAVDVAKEAADIVLLKQDLRTLLVGIFEGRRTHLNIMKYIMMATSSNFGNMFSMAGAALILPFLPMLPLQVLLNNFLYDISEIAIPLDRVDMKSLRHPTHWDIRFVHNFMWIIGLLSSLFDFVTFYVLIRLFHADQVLFHTGWFVESIATQVLVIFIIRTRHSVFRSRASGALILTSLMAVFIAILLPYSPMAKDLGFAPLSFKFFLILGGIVICYLTIVEIVKHWFYSQARIGPR
ncbi:MAG: magnesium-translocating P-type ATPase [Bdellovibrio sp.]|nr:magnesium-translocating P-type ATPase [Bdellovibrio sp.]